MAVSPAAHRTHSATEAVERGVASMSWRASAIAGPARTGRSNQIDRRPQTSAHSARRPGGGKLPKKGVGRFTRSGYGPVAGPKPVAGRR